MKINNTYYKWKLVSPFLNNKWYAFVVNLNATARQLGLFVYNTLEDASQPNPEFTAELDLQFNETKTYTPVDVANDLEWKLLGCSMDITNIRIWKKPIEEELQSLVLSQYVVKDTHLTLLLDNASPELMLPTVTNPR